MTSKPYFVSDPGVPESKPRSDAVPTKEEQPPVATKKPLQDGKTFDLDRIPGFYNGTGGGIS